MFVLDLCVCECVCGSVVYSVCVSRFICECA